MSDVSCWGDSWDDAWGDSWQYVQPEGLPYPLFVKLVEKDLSGSLANSGISAIITSKDLSGEMRW